MSWIVQVLLHNRIAIETTPNIESDEYNNLLIVETKIKVLHEEGFLSDLDMLIIDLVADGSPLKSLEYSIGRNRATISKTFIQICNRIAYFLGGYFTDDGFLDNLKNDNRLSDSDIDKARDYINGKFKHKLMRNK